MSDIETLFFAGIAIFFAYKLWSVFGRTNGDEKAKAAQSGARWTESDKTAGTSTNAKIIPAANKAEAVKEEEVPTHLKDGVEAAKKLDATFSLKKFVEGAAGAFEMVIEGFAAKKRDVLKFLLSKDIYEDFNAEIDKREKEELEANSSVVSIHEPEIIEIEVKGNICHVMVKFISEQINFVKNKAGEVIEGSKSQIDHITDVWTFERDLSSKKPNWTVVEIQAS